MLAEGPDQILSKVLILLIDVRPPWEGLVLFICAAEYVTSEHFCSVVARLPQVASSCGSTNGATCGNLSDPMVVAFSRKIYLIGHAASRHGDCHGAANGDIA